MSETPGLEELVDRVPEGWTPVRYRGRRYGLTRTTRADGRSVSVYAEELGGTDVVSTNVFRTSTGDQLRPCEMPGPKVLAFLRDWTSDDASGAGDPPGREHRRGVPGPSSGSV